MTLLYKEMRLVAHPTSIVFAFLGCLVLVPSYPYSVIFMFGCLAPYITFLNARETNDDEQTTHHAAAMTIENKSEDQTSPTVHILAFGLVIVVSAATAGILIAVRKRNKRKKDISIENTELSLLSKTDDIEELFEQIAETEHLKTIFREISFLSKAYRDVMVMYYIDEIKIKDIAQYLDISENSV